MDQNNIFVLALVTIVSVAVGGQTQANAPTKSLLRIVPPAKIAPTTLLPTSPTMAPVHVPTLPILPPNAPVSAPTAVVPAPVPKKKKIKGKKHIAPAPVPAPLKTASPAPIVAPGTSLETPSPGPSDDIVSDESGAYKLRIMQIVVGCLVLESALFTLF